MQWESVTTEDERAVWETGPRCKSCGRYMRSRGYTWTDAQTFYFYLKCGYCGQRLRGKKHSVEPYIVDWVGLEDLRVVPREGRHAGQRKKYMTARRKRDK